MPRIPVRGPNTRLCDSSFSNFCRLRQRTSQTLPTVSHISLPCVRDPITRLLALASAVMAVAREEVA